MDLEIKINSTDLQKNLLSFERAQFPFVLAKSLTQVAQGAQRVVQQRMPQQFDIRTPWAIKGVRIEPALKSDVKSKGYTESVVKHIDPYMVKQETGGSIGMESWGKSTGGSKSMVIPQQESMLTRSGATKQSMSPRVLLKKEPGRPRKHGKHRKPKAFIQKAKTGATMVYIREGKERYPIKPLYVFAKRVQIHERYDFRNTVQLYVNKNFDKVFAENMLAALQSKKGSSSRSSGR